MLYLLPLVLSLRYFEIWTGPLSSPLDFLSFFRLCFLFFLDFFLCCLSFFFFTTFLDLLRESGLLELLRLLDSDAEEEQDEEEEEGDDEEEAEVQDEEDLLRLRFLFCLLVERLLSSVLELELDTLLSGVDIPADTADSRTQRSQ